MNINNFLILYRFSKKEYLQEIINGKIRFMSAYNYVHMEKQTGIKGIGDRYDSGINMKQYKGHLKLQDGTILAECRMNNIQFDDISNKPIFCCSSMNNTNWQLIENKNNYVYNSVFDELTKEKLRKDFSDSDDVLLFDGVDFFNKLEQAADIIRHAIYFGKVEYENTELNAMEKLLRIKECPDEWYKNHFEKDLIFRHQQEYRAVIDGITLKEKEPYYLNIEPLNKGAVILKKEDFFKKGIQLVFPKIKVEDEHNGK